MKLNDIQSKVVFNSPGNTLVCASPGSGKTRTLVARAQHKLETLPHRKSLALITYTNAGADEIASRLVINNHADLFIGTIHRFCLEYILRPFGWLYKWGQPRVVTYDELLEFVELHSELELGNSALDELNKIKKDIKGNLDITIEWAHNVTLEYVAELFYDFLKVKKAIDFNEILYRSYKIVTENGFVASSLASKFYEISVDEFQDTNLFQYEILRHINAKGICTFFMVGDEKQRIYRFAGAIENAFEEAKIDFSCNIEVLTHVYRSTTNIINAYCALFPDHPKLINESVYKDADYKIVIKQTPVLSLKSTLENYLNQLISRDTPLSEIAILTTRWTDALDVSRNLRDKYRIVGMGALPHKTFNHSTFSLLRSVARFLHATTIRNLRIVRRNIELHGFENNLSLTEKQINQAANLIITQIGNLNKQTTLFDGLIELKKIFSSIFDFSHSAFDEMFSLINEEEGKKWTLEKYLETLSGVDGIMVNTIHQVKGLEYEVVILNEMNHGRIPFQLWNRAERAYDPLTIENESDGRTLFYVGISRAKKGLIVIYSRTPSMFIDIIKPA
jgi:DNA helicase-2/ATP-dependent DNA helicase PcrA